MPTAPGRHGKLFNFSILSTNQVVPTQTSPLSFVETISKVSQGTNDWHREPEALGDSHLHQEKELQQRWDTGTNGAWSEHMALHLCKSLVRDY